MEEIWKDINGFEGLYKVSNLGRVKSIERKVWNPGRNCYRVQKERVLINLIDDKLYHRVNLRNNGRSNQKLVHRLVAEAFIPNPLKLPQINHKDENPSNNNVNNLEWCDNKYNCNYGHHNENISKTQSIPVIQYTLSGEKIREWDSSREVEKELGFSNVNILRCCNGGFFSKRRNKFVNVNQAYGYKWTKKTI